MDDKTKAQRRENNLSVDTKLLSDRNHLLNWVCDSPQGKEIWVKLMSSGAEFPHQGGEQRHLFSEITSAYPKQVPLSRRAVPLTTSCHLPLSPARLGLQKTCFWSRLVLSAVVYFKERNHHPPRGLVFPAHLHLFCKGSFS